MPEVCAMVGPRTRKAPGHTSRGLIGVARGLVPIGANLGTASLLVGWCERRRWRAAVAWWCRRLGESQRWRRRAGRRRWRVRRSSGPRMAWRRASCQRVAQRQRLRGRWASSSQASRGIGVAPADVAGEEGREDDGEDPGLRGLGVAGAEVVELPDALEALEEQFDLPAAAVEREHVLGRPGGGVEGGDQEDEAGREQGCAGRWCAASSGPPAGSGGGPRPPAPAGAARRSGAAGTSRSGSAPGPPARLARSRGVSSQAIRSSGTPAASRPAGSASRSAPPGRSPAAAGAEVAPSRMRPIGHRDLAGLDRLPQQALGAVVVRQLQAAQRPVLQVEDGVARQSLPDFPGARIVVASTSRTRTARPAQRASQPRAAGRPRRSARPGPAAAASPPPRQTAGRARSPPPSPPPAAAPTRSTAAPAPAAADPRRSGLARRRSNAPCSRARSSHPGAIRSSTPSQSPRSASPWHALALVPRLRHGLLPLSVPHLSRITGHARSRSLLVSYP